MSLLASEVFLFFFDIHRSFYAGKRLFPPEDHVFANKMVYVTGGLVGMLIIYCFISLIMYGLKLELGE